MLLSLVLLVFCASPALAHSFLPDLFVDHDDGCLQFKMPHTPGLKEVFIKYMLDKLSDSYDSRYGKATRGVDGFWRLKDEGMNLNPWDQIQYKVFAYTNNIMNIKIESPVSKWVYDPTTTTGTATTAKTAMTTVTIPPTRMSGAVIFREDFSGTSLDCNLWTHEVSMFGGMNWEFQVYTNQKSNVYLKDGYLYLKPTLTIDDLDKDESYLTNGKMDCSEIWEQCTNSANYGCVREGKYGMLPPVMSGKLKSSATIKYGIVEVRACIPKGDWLWPAIWMLPKHNHYGTWPLSGEIDLMESRGNEKATAPDGVNHGVNEIGSTLHWGTAWNENFYALTHEEKIKQQGGWHEECHTWRVERSPDHIITFVDDEELLRVTPPAGGFYELANLTGDNPWASSNSKMAPFDQDFYLILNVAVGGTNGYFPDSWEYATDLPKNNQEFWNLRSKWNQTWIGDKVAMKIDYVEFRHF